MSFAGPAHRPPFLPPLASPASPVACVRPVLAAISTFLEHDMNFSRRKQMEAVVGTLPELKRGLLSDADG